MREILFRGFHEREDGTEKVFVNGAWHTGKWIEGFVIFAGNKAFILTNARVEFIEGYSENHLNFILHEVIPETVGQCTGLNDKNNHCIWEYSECTLKAKGDCYKSKGYIKLLQGCFVFVEYDTGCVFRLCDLIFNTHEIEVVSDFYSISASANSNNPTADKTALNTKHHHNKMRHGKVSVSYSSRKSIQEIAAEISRVFEHCSMIFDDIKKE